MVGTGTVEMDWYEYGPDESLFEGLNIPARLVFCSTKRKARLMAGECVD